MNTTKPTLPAYMASSTDNTLVSSRITGIVIGFSSIIILFAARFFNVVLSANDVVSLATGIGAVAGAIVTVKGFIIWIMTKFGKKTLDVVTPVVAVSPASIVPSEDQRA